MRTSFIAQARPLRKKKKELFRELLIPNLSRLRVFA
jgi:hypothetical protein